MVVDWSQFRDGDRVRVKFEGKVAELSDGTLALVISEGNMSHYLYETGGLGTSIASAKLIERPFTPPPEGALFRGKSSGGLFISLGTEGARPIRSSHGGAVRSGAGPIGWDRWTDPAADIEVLDV